MADKRFNARTVARIAYILGQSAIHNAYPVSSFIKVTTYEKEDVCRIARMLGLQVVKHKGVWYEQDRQIDDILATEYKKKNRS